MSTIRMYWWGGNSHERNFGDDLAPMIVERVSNRRVAFAELERCDLVSTGSLLDRVRMRRWKRLLAGRFHPPDIWGTGSLTELEPWFPNARFHAVRGPLTRKSLRLPGETALGDPALLLPEFLDRPKPQARWGLVPHISHRNTPIFAALASQKSTLRIDLGDEDTLDVARKIAGCDFIISSSLHGLILADAFGIPNIWLDPGVPLSGGGFWKFHDYFESVGRFAEAPMKSEVELSDLEEKARVAPRATVEKRREELRASFPY